MHRGKKSGGNEKMIGKTVTITDGAFEDCQGVVKKEIEYEGEERYVVELDKYFHYLLGSEIVWDDEDGAWPYGEIRVLKKDVVEDELRKEIIVKDLFGNSFTFWNELVRPFSTDTICDYDDCQDKVSRRIMFNFWGSVYEADCCEAHANEFHGKLTEGFVFKK